MSKTMVIAEAGVNHNGEISLAMELVEIAAEAGADFVKFQTFNAERITTGAATKADYQAMNSGKFETQQAMLKKLELTYEMHQVIIEHCSKHEIGFLSTGFDIQSVEELLSLGIEILKIPSGEITNLPYLRYIGQLNKPAIMSTGMATLEEVGDAIRILEVAGQERQQLIILHCSTEYPASYRTVNLNAMIAIQEQFGVRVGYSDHTQGWEVAVAAVSLGACVIEKHFTSDKTLQGPDHQASLEPQELKAMISAIRNVEVALGDGNKIPSAVELLNRDVARKSLVARAAILEGEQFTPDNVTTKRPGTGISPMRWDEVLKQRAPRNFAIDEAIEL